MNMRKQLLNAIAEEYHIRQGANESATDFRARLIYSALCRAAYASLFDEPRDDKSTVSIEHFKGRLDELKKIYSTLYPEVQLPPELSTKIYKLYSSVGYVYHTPYRVSASMERGTEHDGILFLRGIVPSRRIFMSGAGFYLPTDAADFFDVPRLDGIDEMFALPTKTLLETWDDLIHSVDWRQENIFDGAEYLRTTRIVGQTYWSDHPDRDGSISIARVGASEPRLYYFYRFDGKKFFCSQQPHWRMIGAACACLAARGTLPPIKFIVDGAIVRAELGYLPSPPELNLLTLYSWSDASSSAFNRTFDAKIFFALKKILERRGYKFIGE